MDVHVVGAGPSGCFAAIAASKRGLSVKITEEHAKAGLPANCSGLVSASGLEELSDFVDYRKCALNPIYGANLHCGGKTMQVRTRLPVAYVIDRAHFDALCADAAVTSGASLELGRRVSGNYDAGVVIGADGPASHVASHFGFPRQPHFISTYQGLFEYSCPDSNCVEVYLSGHFPGFFGWAIPQSGDRALIGVGVRPPNSSKRAYGYLVKSLGSPKGLANSGFTIPASVRAKTAGVFGSKKVLLVGDAAGQVKATTGGGIYFGASCGRLAGKLCQSPLEYEREWRGRHYFDLLLHRAARRYLDTMPPALTELSFSAANALMLGHFLSEWGHMDRPSRMIGARQLASYARLLISHAAGSNPVPMAVIK